MIELPLVFISGLLGSAHCLGMCGPFALAIGAGTRGYRRNLLRQVSYTAGRIFTYSFLGALAGYGGANLAGATPPWVSAPAALAIVAGVFLVYQGLKTAGTWPPLNWLGARRRVAVTPNQGTCLAASFFASFLRSGQASSVFLAGLFTGFLPCGLVYAFLTLAASSANLWLGAATMAAFGLGTAPLMIVAGWGGNLLARGWRQRLLQLAAWCVVLAGIISIARGVGYLPSPQGAPPACPFCLTAADDS
jgi:sulfite exporter TauE/SafE